MSKKSLFAVVAASFLLTACETMGPKEQTGTVVGGLGGATAGAVIGGDAGGAVAGGVIGLVAGGLLGNVLGSEMDKNDKK